MTDKPPAILFPVSQQESARQTRAECLLARDVFQRIAELLAQQLHALELARQENRLDQLDDCRTHQAILIDGPRGSGKSTVLVNLDVYLGSKLYQQQMPWPDTLGVPRVNIDQLLILKPVDPTLLDDGDDLLLNVIVAALVRNPEVKKKLDAGGGQVDNFYHQLQQLGSMLESLQGQHKAYGLDKLRTFLGGHGLAQVIHELFACALALTGRKLIVLPIDDVDTALEHAYPNLEIVRKYLATPYVAPIVSGDTSLYRTVLENQFLARLASNFLLPQEKFSARTGGGQEERNSKERSRQLSLEYLQKILPPNKSLIMPGFDHVSRIYDIKLVKSTGEKEGFSLSDFLIWMEIFLAGGFSYKETNHVIFANSFRSISQHISSLGDLASQIPARDKKRGYFSINHNRPTRELEWVLINRLHSVCRNMPTVQKLIPMLDIWTLYHYGAPGYQFTVGTEYAHQLLSRLKSLNARHTKFTGIISEEVGSYSTVFRFVEQKNQHTISGNLADKLTILNSDFIELMANKNIKSLTECFFGESRLVDSYDAHGHACESYLNQSIDTILLFSGAIREEPYSRTDNFQVISNPHFTLIKNISLFLITKFNPSDVESLAADLLKDYCPQFYQHYNIEFITSLSTTISKWSEAVRNNTSFHPAAISSIVNLERVLSAKASNNNNNTAIDFLWQIIDNIDWAIHEAICFDIGNKLATPPSPSRERHLFCEPLKYIEDRKRIIIHLLEDESIESRHSLALALIECPLVALVDVILTAIKNSNYYFRHLSSKIQTTNVLRPHATTMWRFGSGNINTTSLKESVLEITKGDTDKEKVENFILDIEESYPEIKLLGIPEMAKEKTPLDGLQDTLLFMIYDLYFQERTQE